MPKRNLCSVIVRPKKTARRIHVKNGRVETQPTKGVAGIFRGVAGEALDINAVAIMTKNIQNMFKSDVDETATAINGIKQYSKEELNRKYSNFN